MELTEQMRAVGDTKHAKLLAQLRTTSDTPDPRRSLEILKTLSENDIQQDPEWTRATIVVTSKEISTNNNRNFSHDRTVVPEFCGTNQ